MQVRYTFAQEAAKYYLIEKTHVTAVAKGSGASAEIFADAFDIFRLQDLNETPNGPGVQVTDTIDSGPGVAAQAIALLKKETGKPACNISVDEHSVAYLNMGVRVKTKAGWGDFDPGKQIEPNHRTQTIMHRVIIYDPGGGQQPIRLDNADKDPNVVLDVTGSGEGHGNIESSWQLTGDVDGDGKINGTFWGITWRFGEFSDAKGAQSMDKPQQAVSGSV